MEIDTSSNNSILQSQFYSFFTINEEAEKNLDNEAIWNKILQYYPKLNDETLDVSLIKKEILKFLENKEIVKNIEKYFDCSIREIMKVLIEMQYLAFDKHLIKKIIKLLNE